MEHVLLLIFYVLQKKSRCGILFHSMWAHSKNGNFGLIQPYQVNGVTLFWYTYIVGFFFKDLLYDQYIGTFYQQISLHKFYCRTIIILTCCYYLALIFALTRSTTFLRFKTKINHLMVHI